MISIQRLSLAWILAFLSILFLSFVQLLGSMSAALFLACGVACVALFYRHGIYAVVKYWPLHLLPIYCIASGFWSNYPNVSFRYGIQLMLTLLLGMCFAAIFKFEQYMKILALALGILMVACLALQASDLGAANWLGIFGSKNQLAQHAIITVFCCSYFVRDKFNLIYRAAALGMIFFSMFLLVMAHSAGAVVVFMVSYAVLFVFVAFRKLKPAVKLIALFYVGLGAAFFYFLFQATNFSIMEQITDAFGKDRTLTGRTDLWDYAIYLFKEDPILGQGFRGFWVIGNSRAEDLWAQFFVPSGAGFSFHNMYLSNLVDLGLAGMAIQGMLFVYAVFVSAKIEILYGDRENSVIFIYFVYTIIIGLSETPVFTEFSLPSVIYYSFLVYLRERSLELRDRSNANKAWLIARSQRPRFAFNTSLISR